MITKLTLKNFRCFDDFTLDGIRPVTLIAGKNDVGKSTLLESIYLFMERNSSNVFLTLNNIRGIPQVNLSPLTVWESLFPNMDVSKSIEISLKTNNADEQTLVIKKDDSLSLISISEALPKNYGLSAAKAYPLKFSYKDSTGCFDSIFALTETGIVLTVQKPVVSNMPRVNYLNSNAIINVPKVVEWFGQIDLIGKKSRCVEILQKLDSRIKDLSIILIGSINGIYADVGLASKLSINVLGDGINKLLHIILAMLANPNSLILIDEIENGFHHSFYPKLWDIIGELTAETGCQVFATTHSYECIEDAISLATDENNPEFFRFVRLDRENGKIVPKVYGNTPFQNALKIKWEVR